MANSILATHTSYCRHKSLNRKIPTFIFLRKCLHIRSRTNVFDPLRDICSGNALEWHIHFWLGSETSQDESTVAAYKTVELDESLGGGPVQHREVEGNESDKFMTYFKETGLEYLPGGVDSGLNTVEKDVYRTRLLQCKGKRSVRCFEKPTSTASLNKGDVFILDMGLTIYLYNGDDSNKYEKVKGAEMCQKINNERGGRCNIVLLEDEPDAPGFWDTLGGQIEVSDPGEDDEAAAAAAAGELKLFHIDGDDGTCVREHARTGCSST